MRCWNCLHQNNADSARCESCDQALRPNPQQRTSSRHRIEYLLREIESWPHLKKEEREEVARVYRSRLARLDLLHEQGAEAETGWPQSDWIQATVQEFSPEPEITVVDSSAPTVPSSTAAPRPSELPSEPIPELGPIEPDPVTLEPTPATTETPLPVSTAPKAPGLVERLAEESDIRWFHTLGTLLVVAAVVGWLRSSWDSYGRQVTGILIALSPILFHLTAARLKKSVPLSARLLTTLSNVLTPLALLSLEIFGNLPPGIPSKIWWTFSFAVSAPILLVQAHRSKERAPLFMGGFCAILAGWSQGALSTAAFSLALGFYYQWSTRSGDDEEWVQQCRQMGFYAGSFGAAASLFLFDTSRHPVIPVAGFAVALLFLSLPQLLGQSEASSEKRVILQAVFSLVGGILMRSQLGLPPGGVALILLFATAMLLAAKPDSPVAASSARAASLIGALAVFIGFGNNILEAVFCRTPLDQTVFRVAFGLAGCAYFFLTSRHRPSQQGTLFTYSLLCFLGAWIHLFLRMGSSQLGTTVGSLDPQAITLRVYLVASLPILVALILLLSRILNGSERALCWRFCSCLYLLPFGLSLSCRGFLGEGHFPEYSLALLAHLPVILFWERGWLAGATEGEEQDFVLIRAGLPRAVLASFALGLLAVSPLPLQDRLAILSGVGVVGVLLFPLVYREGAFELFWLALFSWTFQSSTPLHRWAAAVGSFLVALTLASRKLPSIILSTSLCAVVMLTTVPRQATPLYYLPLLLLLVVGQLRSRGEESPADLQAAKVAFPTLAVLALFLAPGPSEEILRLCYGLSIAAIQGLIWYMVSFETPLKSRLSLVVSPSGPPVVLAALVVWSLFQTPLLFGSLLLVLGLGSGTATVWRDHRDQEAPSRSLQLSWGLFLYGLAQVFAPEFFRPHPDTVVWGAILGESILAIRPRYTVVAANLALLSIVYFQVFTGGPEPGRAAAFALAALMVSVSAFRQERPALASWGSWMLLASVDSLIGGDALQFKVRLLPAVAYLAGVGLWKRRGGRKWPDAVLRLAYLLLVVPASFQFLVGTRSMENFTWLLLIGAALIGVHRLVPSDLHIPFRRAGGSTLLIWVALSLTRAALQLPWQAATLVIGVALVSLGVWIEKQRRNRSS